MSTNALISQVRELVRQELGSLVDNPQAPISQSYLVVKNEFAGVRFIYDDLSAFWKFNESIVRVYRNQEPISMIEIKTVAIPNDSSSKPLNRAA